jgi:hypothetical protein
MANSINAIGIMPLNSLAVNPEYATRSYSLPWLPYANAADRKMPLTKASFRINPSQPISGSRFDTEDYPEDNRETRQTLIAFSQGLIQHSVITRFEGVYAIQLRFGAAPCHVYHMTDGRCKHAECTHLHDQIRFTPTAHAAYRAFLNRRLCPHGKTCKHRLSGTCFYDHDCPGYANCNKPDCPYEHRQPVLAQRPLETTQESFEDRPIGPSSWEDWRRRPQPSMPGPEISTSPSGASRGGPRHRKKSDRSTNPNLIQPTWRDWTPSPTE